MPRFTKQLVLMLLFLVVINAAPQRRQRNARSLDQRMGDLLLETPILLLAPQRKFTDSLKGQSLDQRMGDLLPETRALQRRQTNARTLDQRMGDLRPQKRILPLVAGLIGLHIWDF